MFQLFCVLYSTFQFLEAKVESGSQCDPVIRAGFGLSHSADHLQDLIGKTASRIPPLENYGTDGKGFEYIRMQSVRNIDVGAVQETLQERLKPLFRRYINTRPEDAELPT